MSCRVTGGPIRGLSPTSVLYVRRNSPAVTICQNTSKSTVFHEAVGQSAQQTDAPPAEITGITGNPWNTLILYQYFLKFFLPLFFVASSASHLEYVSWSKPHLAGIVLSYCKKPTRLPSCLQSAEGWCRCFGRLRTVLITCLRRK